MYMFRFSKIVLIAFLLIYGESDVLAEESKPVFIPIPFYADTGRIETSSYFGIKEDLYSKSWIDFKKQAGSLDEKILVNIIDAISEGNLEQIKQLSDKKVIEESTARYDKFMYNFFEIWKGFTQVRVGRKFSYNNEVVFTLEGYLGGKAIRSLFRFHYQSNGELSYVPYGKKSIGFDLLSFWAISAAGNFKSVEPRPLNQWSNSDRLNYRVIFKSKKERAPHVYIAFNGAQIKSESLKSVGVMKIFKEIQKALAKGDYIRFYSYFTEPSADYLRRGFTTTMSIEERKQYINNFIVLKPVFEINADPLYVLYTRSLQASKHLEVIYFIKSQSGSYRVTNIGRITPTDAIFSGKEFRGGVLEQKPFESMKVNIPM